MKVFALRLPDPLAARLASLARARGRAKSVVVRDLLEQVLANCKQPPVSCLVLAGDLVGCLQGPGDLSVNKKYMEGFGK